MAKHMRTTVLKDTELQKAQPSTVIARLFKIFPYPYAHYPIDQARRFSDKVHGCPESQASVFHGSLPKQPISLEANGLWRCYELEFSVDTPSPKEHFQISLQINNELNEVGRSITVPFASYEWGHSDSFP